jgi:hypothetical protein
VKEKEGDVFVLRGDGVVGWMVREREVGCEASRRGEMRDLEGGDGGLPL